jgi:transcriptional regulator GlxA family with amidase domain
MLVADAGLMTGHSATTHRAARDALAGSGARLVDARIDDDGHIVSSAGVTSGLDLALWLVERYFGAALAAAVAHQIEYVRRGPIWQAAGSASHRAWTTRPETTKTAR